MAGQTFTGQTLVDALSAGEFEHPSGVVLTGMVKQSEQPDHIAFARGGCDTWIDLPTTMIDQAEHVGSRPCEDHAHPLFRITLAESDDPQAKLLGTLLASQPQAAGRAPLPGLGLHPPGRRQAASRAALPQGFHDSCLWACDYLVRECVLRGGDYDTCIGLRATCSDICSIFSTVFEPVYW